MEKLISRLKAETRAKVASIKREADKEAEAIIKEAKEKAKRIKAEILEKAKKKAEMERQRIIATARLNAKKEKAKLIDELFEEVVENAIAKLSKVRGQKRYAKLISELIKKASEQIADNSVVVVLPKGDKGKIKIPKLKGKKIKVEQSSKLKAGCIVKASDNSVLISSDFEELLMEKKQAVKALLKKFIEGE